MQRVGNLSQRWARATLDVPVALDADLPTAKSLVHDVATALAQDPVYGQDVIGPPEVWGVQDFGPEGVRIRVVIPTKPLRNWDLARQLRERLKLAFDDAGIRMPGQLVDLAGQGAGYPVLTSRLDPTTEAAQHRRHADPSVVWSEGRAAGMAGGDEDPSQVPVSDEATDDAPDDPADGSADPTDPSRLRGPRPGTEPLPKDGGGDDVHEEPKDATMELRLRQGPRPRPD